MLLATGGLINAYGNAAEEAVLNAEKVEDIEYLYFNLKVRPSEYSKVTRLLKSHSVKIIRQDFDELHIIDVQIDEEKYLSISSELKLCCSEINQYS